MSDNEKLSALPGEAEVVGWRYCDHDVNGEAWPWVHTTTEPHPDHSEVEPLVTLASFQAMQARADADAKMISDLADRAEAAERYRHSARLDRITAERDAQNMANQLVAAEVRVKELEEERDALQASHNENAKLRGQRDAALARVDAAEARVKDAVGLLDHLIGWIVYDCGAEPPFTSDQDETYTALKGGSNG